MVSIWKYARDDLNNFLVFYLPPECEINEFELKMSAHLQTCFLTPIYDERFDPIPEEDCALTKRLDHDKIPNVEITSRRVIKYKISNVVMLSSYLNKSEMPPEEVFRIMEQILDTYYQCIDYLLVPNQILFDPDKMFFDFRTQRVYLLYIPVNEYDGFSDFKEFIISYFSLFSGQRAKAEASDRYEEIIRYCKQDSFCMDGFRAILLHYKKEILSLKSERDALFSASDMHSAFERPSVSADLKQKKVFEAFQKEEESNPEERKYFLQTPEKYERKEGDIDPYALKRRRKKVKHFLIKTAGMYSSLTILFLILMSRSGGLFGESSEIKTFIAILFFSICVYCYIRFLHEDVMELLESRKKKGKKLEKIQREEEPISERIHPRTAEGIEPYYSETIRKNMYFETELLTPKSSNYLINTLTGEKVYIDKNIFKIGRHEEENDFIVEDKSVGRFHIQLDTSEKGVEITDLGSKNGTFINERRIFPYTRSILNKGDIIRLAGTSFSFNA